MAHESSKRTQLRSLYIYQRLPMDACCTKLGIPRSTANRWKAEARERNDDWDRSRAAVSMGDESFGNMSRKLLDDYLVQHQATMDMLRDSQLDAMQRAEILASMSDSFNKTMASFKRLSPELNRQAIALDALQRFARFAEVRFPQHVALLIEMLEPFGQELATVLK